MEMKRKRRKSERELDAIASNAKDDSLMAPDIDPIAQQRVFRLAHDHSDPST